MLSPRTIELSIHNTTVIVPIPAILNEMANYPGVFNSIAYHPLPAGTDEFFYKYEFGICDVYIFCPAYNIPIPCMISVRGKTPHGVPERWWWLCGYKKGLHNYQIPVIKRISEDRAMLIIDGIANRP
jgi:hypothetical protein